MENQRSVVVTGCGSVVLAAGDPDHTCDPRSLLGKRKNRKYMGPQDDMAVVAAARALSAAGLPVPLHRIRVGMFLVVGHIPFEEQAIDEVVQASMRDGVFSMAAFSTTGMQQINPLLSFRCLPNMPAFHIAANLGLSGPYCIGYPGPGQLYLALEQAVLALACGCIDAALVGAVADQRNFLVRHHFRRLDWPVEEDRLANAAGFMVVESEQAASARAATILARLAELDFAYHHHDPFATSPPPAEDFTVDGPARLELPGDLGPASLPVALALATGDHHATTLHHSLQGRDGTVASSRWSLHSAALGAPVQGRLAAILTPRATPHRVVVTGMGVVSPLGNGVQGCMDRLLAGDSGIGPITVFDPAELATRIAGEARLPADAIRLRDRKIAFAVEAARQAMEAGQHCGTSPGLDSGAEQAALSLGIGLELFSLEDMVAYRAGAGRLPRELSNRLTFLQTPSDLCLHLISHRLGLHQPPQAHVGACAAGADAIGAAARLVATGQRRWMVAGGTDSMINPLGVGGFCLLGATSRQNRDPAAAARPFDRSRDGFVLGEGAAVLVLERLEDALERGAHIHAEVLGHGCSLDTHSITAPDPGGRGALLAMRRALDAARITAAEVGCVNAHATSTPLNDRVEAAAIRELLGERAGSVPVCANKSMMGHLISAAGAVEAVLAVACLEAGVLPPTVNLDDPDPLCELDHVRGAARHHRHEVVLSNSFGFGGVNACLVFRRYPHA